jgi:cytochrome c oxidase subunit II
MFLDLQIPLWPASASTNAAQVDAIYAFLVAVSAVMTILIFVAVFAFAIKYRRKSEREIPPPIHGSLRLEIAWSILPFLVMLVMFFWGTKVYFDNAVPPADAMDIYVVGKQWMWKMQYPDGQREINELHVPIGQPVRLTLASEDVIHSFFIPAFRVKHDVVPGRLNTLWFNATKAGRYHIFCAEYCGTEHSGMIGWVNVMEPAEYENWLSGGGAEGSMASQGEKLFQQYGCSTCHLLDEQGRCPIMRGVYGSRVLLQDGRTVLADDAYIRESILNPNAKIVSGFKPDVMPTFQGQISEEDILKLIVYIKSLAIKKGGATAGEQPTSIPALPEATSQAVRRGARTDNKK